MVVREQDLKARAAALAAFVGMMWFVHLLDTFRPGAVVSIAGLGIVPRTWAGLYGIPIAPFVHASWQHLISNTVPLIILGALVLMRGLIEFWFVLFTTVMISGLGTWLFGTGNAQHVGASGVVFGLFGYLVFRTAFDRKVISAIITLIVGIGFGTAMAASLVPEAGISWSGHFFGFVGGFLAARLRYPSRARREVTAKN